MLALGFVHVVYGGAVGLAFCAKDGWAASDTLVDIGDLTGKPPLLLLDRARLVHTMVGCGVLKKPE